MRAVSDRFLRTLRGSHAAAIRARVCAPGQAGTSPTGTDIPVLGGDVGQDAVADIRSTLDLSTEGEGMWPSKADPLLAPYGNEVFVERGITYGDGATEWVSLGYYRIYNPEQDDPPGGPIRIAGKDRMSGIIDAKLLNPVQFAATAARSTVMSQLVTEVYPGAIIEWDSGDATTIGRTLVAEEDRYGFLNDLVVAAGKTWYWDYRGHLIIKDPPNPGNPVFDVDHGQDGVLIDLSRDLTREGLFNAVVASGEASGDTAPARAIAVDNNPNSPTYWYGTFGKVPTFYSSSFITTNTQALVAAESLLSQSLGLPYNVNFGSIVNPALEVNDPIRVLYPPKARSRSSVAEHHIIEKLTVPLVANEALTATTKEKTLIILGQTS